MHRTRRLPPMGRIRHDLANHNQGKPISQLLRPRRHPGLRAGIPEGRRKNREAKVRQLFPNSHASTPLPVPPPAFLHKPKPFNPPQLLISPPPRAFRKQLDPPPPPNLARPPPNPHTHLPAPHPAALPPPPTRRLPPHIRRARLQNPRPLTRPRQRQRWRERTRGYVTGDDRSGESRGPEGRRVGYGSVGRRGEEARGTRTREMTGGGSVR